MFDTLLLFLLSLFNKHLLVKIYCVLLSSVIAIFICEYTFDATVSSLEQL